MAILPEENPNAVVPNKGVPATQPKPQTPQQAGQKANAQVTAEVKQGAPMTELAYDQNKSAEQNLEELTSQGAIVAQIVERGLKAKQQAVPYDEEIRQQRKKMGRLSFDDYKGIPMQDALRLMNNDIAEINSTVGYYEGKKQEALDSANTVVSDFKDLLNSQLQAIGLRVESERDLRDFKENQRQFDKSFEEQQRQFNVSQANRGGSGGKSQDKESLFKSAVSDAILALDTDKLEWDTVFDMLRNEFPEKSENEISDALRGKVITQDESMSLARPVLEGRAKTTAGSQSREITDEQVWAQIGNLSPEDQADTEYVRSQIMSLGKDPEKFGY